MPKSVFFRLLKENEKEAALHGCICDLCKGRENVLTHAVRQDTFALLPGSPMPYWVSDAIRRKFQELPVFEKGGRTAKQGLATADDFRFVRAWWEVPSEHIGHTRERTLGGKRWVAFAKGGEYSPYYQGIHLVVNWGGDGEELRHFDGAVVRNESYYFQPGLTWPARPHRKGSFSFLPSGCIFSHSGMALFEPRGSLAGTLALLNSTPYLFLLSLLMARGTEGGQTMKYEVGYVKSVPLPRINPTQEDRFSVVVRLCHDLNRDLHRAPETSRAFTQPALMVPQVAPLEMELGNSGSASSNLEPRFLTWLSVKDAAELEVIENSYEIDQAVVDLYEISEQDREIMDRELGPHAGSHPRKHEWTTEDDEKLRRLYPDEGGDLEKIAHSLQVHPESVATRRQALGLYRPQDFAQAVADLISYCIGCLFGRWDIRIGAGQLEPPPLPDPEDGLPLYPPGALRPDSPPLEPAGPPAQLIERSASLGILVDDQGHKQDLAAGVEACLAYLFGEEQLPALRREMEEVLGRDLREWLARDFFPLHIKRYSKSRRKSPIYWQLTAPGRGYSLWLYYHALRPDTLYTAVRQYVTPKLEFEEGRLKQLRAKFAEVRETGPAPEARRLEKAAEDEEAFLQEVYALRSELQRLADWGYDPDLNDGVIINIAALHRLVPWNEAGRMWDELEQGKYEWSTMAQHMKGHR